jgi:hypothetical protein
MTTPEPEDDSFDAALMFRQFLERVYAHRWLISRGTLAATAITMIVGGLYFLMQPTVWTAAIEFRPAFEGADLGQYPNKLPFLPSDVTDPSVIQQVFLNNHVGDFCQLSPFQAGFAVAEGSTELQVLDLDYLARLSDTKLTGIERQRLQDEYVARRKSAPIHYRVTFARPPECAKLPPAIALKALEEVLEVWASDADSKRGVTKLHVALLSPNAFDLGSVDSDSLLIRADLIRTTLSHLLISAQDIALLPGSELVRFGPKRESLIEIRDALSNLIQAHLDPLVALAGRGLGVESMRWVSESLATANTSHDAAVQKLMGIQTALREYAGTSTTPPTGGGVGMQKPGSPGDVQTISPQIDATFIDRIVAMSGPNQKFREELTRKMLEASAEAIEAGRTVEHYKQLLASLSSVSGSQMKESDVKARLDQISAEGRALATDLSGFYDEFSRVSLRVGSALYQLTQPEQSVTIRAFTLRSLGELVVIVFGLTLILLTLGCLVADRLRSK